MLSAAACASSCLIIVTSMGSVALESEAASVVLLVRLVLKVVRLALVRLNPMVMLLWSVCDILSAAEFLQVSNLPAAAASWARNLCCFKLWL